MRLLLFHFSSENIEKMSYLSSILSDCQKQENSLISLKCRYHVTSVPCSAILLWFLGLSFRYHFSKTFGMLLVPSRCCLDASRR